MNKTPKTEWKAGKQKQDDLQISYIAKSVAYDDYDGVCLFVGRKEDETVPFTFYYFFALDIDQQKPVKLTFQRRGKKIVSMSCPLDDIQGDITLIMPNVIEFSNAAESVNLFAVHNKSDTVSFTYTATDGTPKNFKFPLAGFNEKYLEQFI